MGDGGFPQPPGRAQWFYPARSKYGNAAKTAGYNHKWYDVRPEFQTKLCTGRAAGLACDEFPFWVTNQAVNLSGLVADVQPVPGTESSPQGNDISGFYRKCDVDDGERFIVLPVKPWVAANGPSFGFTVNQGGASLCMTPEAPAAP